MWVAATMGVLGKYMVSLLTCAHLNTRAGQGKNVPMTPSPDPIFFKGVQLGAADEASCGRIAVGPAADDE